MQNTAQTNDSQPSHTQAHGTQSNHLETLHAPWDQQPNEPDDAYQAFRVYLRQRNPLQVAVQLLLDPTMITKWSVEFNWSHRADAHDQHTVFEGLLACRQAAEEIQPDWAGRSRLLEEETYLLACMANQAARIFLTKFLANPPENIKLSDLLRLIALAQKLSANAIPPASGPKAKRSKHSADSAEPAPLQPATAAANPAATSPTPQAEPASAETTPSSPPHQAVPDPALSTQPLGQIQLADPPQESSISVVPSAPDLSNIASASPDQLPGANENVATVVQPTQSTTTAKPVRNDAYSRLYRSPGKVVVGAR